MLLGLGFVAVLQAVQPAAVGAPDPVTMVRPGAQYDAGWIRRFLFGRGWRVLWSTPIAAPLANLDSTQGGLVAYDRAGSGQTPSLRFCTPDGRTYQFRSVDKDPGQHTSGLGSSPPVHWVYRDHISAMLPTGALAVGKLEETAGLFPTERWLAVLPDSPRLGEWREEFRGMLGIFEFRHTNDEECQHEMRGAPEVVTSDTLFRRLRDGGLEQVDQRRYLATRLVDLFINDSDRHPDQLRWSAAGRESVHRWEPIPRDRDWALSHSDGLAYDLSRLIYPLWQEFGPRYGSLTGLTSKSESIDRRLLNGLDREMWDSVAKGLGARLSDSAIDAAVAALPGEFDRQAMSFLAASLKSRRDALPQVAAEFYGRLAERVDLFGSDRADLVTVVRGDDGSVAIEVLAPDRTSVYRRRFLPEETREIRMHLLGGGDTLRVRGASAGIPIRVITGGGPDLVVDSTGGDALRVYDDPGSATVQGTGKVRRTVRAFESPIPPNDLINLHRDWGRRIGLAHWFKVRPELGVILGGGPVLYTYGFRRVPHQSKLTFRAATTTGVGRLNLELKGDFRFEHPGRRVLVRAAALNADVIRYFGPGNETVRSSTPGFNNITRRQYVFQPAVEFRFRNGGILELGGVVQWTEPDRGRLTLVAAETPYGAGSFAEAGLTAAVGLDTRDNRTVPTSGVTLSLAGRVFPALLDVERAFGSLSIEGTTYLAARGLPTAPTLALRAGGTRVLGTAPFFEAATIGGRGTFRGLTTRRFQGDGAVYGNLELRLNLGDVTSGTWGIFGLTDVGRVFVDGENSNRWHTTLGGGVWLAQSGKNRVFTLTVAGAGEALKVYAQIGFHF